MTTAIIYSKSFFFFEQSLSLSLALFLSLVLFDTLSWFLYFKKKKILNLSNERERERSKKRNLRSFPMFRCSWWVSLLLFQCRHHHHQQFQTIKWMVNAITVTIIIIIMISHGTKLKNGETIHSNIDSLVLFRYVKHRKKAEPLNRSRRTIIVS